MSNPNIIYDDVTQRFINNIMKTVTNSLTDPKQNKVSTPTNKCDLQHQYSTTSNSNASVKQNPIHGILNAALNFNSSPDVAKNLMPVADIIMETINVLIPQPPTEPKKKSCMKDDKNDDFVKKPIAPVCTGIELSAPNENTTSTGVTLDDVSGTKCEHNHLSILSNKISELRAEIIKLPDGNVYLNMVDAEHDAVLYQILMKQYEKMQVFYKNNTHAVSESIASIIQKQNPTAILPDNAKKMITSYINETCLTKPISDIYDIITLTKPKLTKLESVVASWLSENTAMYVVV